MHTKRQRQIRCEGTKVILERQWTKTRPKIRFENWQQSFFFKSEISQPLYAHFLYAAISQSIKLRVYIEQSITENSGIVQLFRNSILWSEKNHAHLPPKLVIQTINENLEKAFAFLCTSLAHTIDTNSNCCEEDRINVCKWAGDRSSPGVARHVSHVTRNF